MASAVSRPDLTGVYTDYAALRADLASGKVTAAQIVEAYLTKAKADQNLNIWLELFEQDALTTATQVQQTVSNAEFGELAGMVVGLKDVLCYAGHGLQASSKILSDFKSQFTGAPIQRLLDAGAVMLGRQNCDEFAMGGSNEHSAFGPVRNPYDASRVPGGSSGGSAASVAAGHCTVALGSDTGGSVRQPAAFCGIVGFKPGYGRISRFGLIAYASSFDSIGVFAHNVTDVARVMNHLAGADGLDSTASQAEVPDYVSAVNAPVGKKRIAVLKESFSDSVQPEIKAALQAKIESLKAAGHTVEEVSFTLLDYVLPTYYILTTAEASSNLSRYDGVRFGHRSEAATDLTSLYKRTRSEGFGTEVKKRILMGTFVLSASYYDAYFTKAQRVRRMVQQETLAFFDSYDFILMPTTPTTAYEIGSKQADPLAEYLGDVFTVQANVAGIPAISVPAGYDNIGLPIGVQLMANKLQEANLLQFANYLHQLQ